jgi:hypothetical protein
VNIVFVWVWNIGTCRNQFKKGKGKRVNNGGDELKEGTLYTYTEISQNNAYTATIY